MKEQIKRHYRSAVSILLSVCILVSCMTVGLIATDAAKASEDEVLGETEYYFYGKSNSGNWSTDKTAARKFEKQADGSYTLEMPFTKNEADFCIVNSSDTKYAASENNDAHRKFTDSNLSVSLKSGSGDHFCFDGTTGTYTITLNSSLTQITLSKAPAYYLIGDDFQADDPGNTWKWDNTKYPLTKVSSTDYIREYIPTGDHKYFRVHNKSRNYTSPSTPDKILSTEKQAISGTDTGNGHAFYTDGLVDTKIIVHFDPTSGSEKIWYTLPSVYMWVSNTNNPASGTWTKYDMTKDGDTWKYDGLPMNNDNSTYILFNSSSAAPNDGNGKQYWDSTGNVASHISETPAGAFKTKTGQHYNASGDYYFLKMKPANNGFQYNVVFTPSSTLNSSTVAFTMIGDSVVETLTLSASPNPIPASTTTNETTLTATATLKTPPVVSKYTYKFYNSSGKLVGQYSTTTAETTASVTVEQLSSSESYYVVVTSDDDSTPTMEKKSSSVTVTNEAIPVSDYKIIGSIVGTTGSWENYDDPYAQPFANWEKDKIFYYVKDYTSDTNNTNFRVVKKNTTPSYAPSGGNHELVQNAAFYDTIVYTNNSATFSFNNDKKTKYRIYIDESGTTPKIRLTYDTDVVLSENLAGKISNGVLNDSSVSFERPFNNTKVLNGGTTFSSEEVYAICSYESLDDIADYTIDQSSCAGVEIRMEEVTRSSTDEPITLVYVKPKTGNTNCTLHFNPATKKVWATAVYDEYGAATQYAYDGSDETVRYYFAKPVRQETTLDGNSRCMKIKVWNNNLEKAVPSSSSENTSKFGRIITANPVDKDGNYCTQDSNNNVIYVNCKETIASPTNEITPFGWDRNEQFYIYAADVPIWATTFCFLNSSDGELNNSDTYRIGAMNHNRVYLFFDYSSAKRTGSVILDKSLWDSSKHKNLTDTMPFKSNLIKLNKGSDKDYSTVNDALVNVYQAKDSSMRDPLYWGDFWKAWNSEITPYWNFQPRNNLAQRYSGEIKTFGNSSYHAIVYNLTGKLLDKSRTNDNGGYYLQDPTESFAMPFFDYEALENDSAYANIAKEVVQGVDFPFYKSTYKGVTTYSYDSLTDPNRTYSSGAFTIGGYPMVGDYHGYKPFSDQAYGVLTEFDIPFYMTSTGKIKGEDITFNFSGDDDVWVYIDGVRVLDIGGDHMISAGTINLSEMKTYYKSTGKVVTGLADGKDGNLDTYSTNSTKMYQIDLRGLFAAYGVDFDNTDPVTKHKLQMFYTERGMFESNCSISFNLVQNSGLKVRNNVDVSSDSINPAFVNEVQNVANKDYFQYEIANTLANSTDVAKVTSEFGAVKGQASTSDVASFAPDTEPDYPVKSTTAVHRKIGPAGSETSYTLIPNTNNAGTASKSSYTVSDNKINLKDVNYQLADSHLDSSIAEPSGKVTGDTTNTFNLMFDESANFVDKLVPQTVFNITQLNTLKQPSQTGDNEVVGAAASSKTVADRYLTAYTITDDVSGRIIGERKLASNYSNGSPVSITADDSSELDGFYFTNYKTTDSDTLAMTVDYVNKPATGDIKIKKVIDGATTKKVFKFTVEFQNVFGGDSALAEYSNLTYDIINKSGSVETSGKNYGSGITLQDGQTAVIKNVPVGTTYTVQEQDTDGYELEQTSGTVTTDSVSTVTATDGVFTQTVPSITSAFSNSQANYLFTNKEKLQKVTIKKVINNSGDTDQEFPVTFKVTEADMLSYTYKVGNGDAVTVDTSNEFPSVTVNIKQGTDIVLDDLPVGAKVEVEEGALPTNFSFVSIGVDNKAASSPESVVSGRKVTFYTQKEKDPTVTITNEIATRNVTVYKKVNAAKDKTDTTPFEIELSLTEKGASGAKTLTSADVDTTNTTSGLSITNNIVVMNADDDHITIKVPIDATLKVEETSMSDNFYFEKITTNVGGSDMSTNGSYTVPVSTDDSNVYVYNLKRTSAVITKNIVDTDISDPDSAFTVAVYLTLPGGTEAKLQDVAAVAENKITYTTTGTENAENKTFELKDTKTITINGLVKGTVIKVVETSTGSYSYRDCTVTRETAKEALEAGVTATVGTEQVDITVNNQIKRRAVEIHKSTDTTPTAGTKFKIKVERQDVGHEMGISGSYKLNGTGSDISFATAGDDAGVVELENGEFITIENVPVGTQFKVTEVTPISDNFNFGKITVTNLTTPITDGTNPTTFTVDNNAATAVVATVNNTKQNSLLVKKEIINYTDASQAFYFKVLTGTFNSETSKWDYTPYNGSFKIRTNGSDATGSYQSGDHANQILVHQNQSVVIEGIALNQRFKVVEISPEAPYTYKATTLSDNFDNVAEVNSPENQHGKEFYLTSGTGNVVIQNQRVQDVYIKKELDSDVIDNATSFQIKIEKKGTGDADFSPVTTGVLRDNQTATADENNYFAINKTQTLKVTGVPTGTIIRVTEFLTSTVATYYHYDKDNSGVYNDATKLSEGVTDVNNGTEQNPVYTGLQYQVNNFDPTFILHNASERVNLTVYKRVVNYDQDDESLFPIQVVSKQRNEEGNASANNNGTIHLTNGTTTAHRSDDGDGIYNLRKDEFITFSNIPKGTYFEVSEDGENISYSTKVGNPDLRRFTYKNTTKVEGETETPFTGSNAIEADTVLNVNNQIKMSKVALTKLIPNKSYGESDTKDNHTITVKIYRNSAINNEGQVVGEGEYDKISYILKENAQAATGTTHTVNNGGEITIQKDQVLEFTYPVGSAYEIQETNAGTEATTGKAYIFQDITANSVYYYGYNSSEPKPLVHTDANTPIKFITTDTRDAQNVQITNMRDTSKTVSITKKLVGGNSGDTEFSIEVMRKSSAQDSSYAYFTGDYTSNVTGRNGFFTESGIVKLLQNETITFKVNEDDFVKIRELDISGYEFSYFKIDSDETQYTTNPIERQISADTSLEVWNEESDFYYEITYYYEMYAKNTYQDINDRVPEKRTVGEDRFYKTSGSLTKDDFNNYFTFDESRNVIFNSEKENARKNFISAHAPYEDDFMLSLTWDDTKTRHRDYQYDKDNRTVKIITTATSDPDRRVYALFKMPYAVDDNLDPTETGDVHEIPENQRIQKETVTQYANWMQVGGKFVTAPKTIKDGETTKYFRYWQMISRANNNSGRNAKKVTTNYKRCYFHEFNMTLYLDTYIEPIYKTAEDIEAEGGTTVYSPSAVSMLDTQNGEAKINFIENSRNQWNNDGAPDFGTNPIRKKSGDIIYSDFLLTFGYQDKMLQTGNDDASVKIGFVLEKVDLLEKDADHNYITETQTAYHERYSGSEDDAIAAIQNMILQNKTSAEGVTVRDEVKSSLVYNDTQLSVTQLDNKNQIKYSLATKNKDYSTEEDLNNRLYVYRAYSYTRFNSNNVVVSAPVYFTIYDMASVQIGSEYTGGGQS